MSDRLFADHVPLVRPWLDDDEISAVAEVIRSGWVAQGPRTAEFEVAVARLVGAKEGVATNSATSALYLALRTSGIDPGDEVILPSLTCMATANAVLMLGAVPRFADTERDTYNLDARDVETKLTSRTRAVLVVDQIGLPADLDAFVDLCAKKSLVLVEDAATAFGARYKGRYLGAHGIPTVYSFHPRKMITTGEGGMFMTHDPGAAEKARVIRSAGTNASDLARHLAKGTIVQEYTEAGFNFRLTDLQAAMGLVQLRRLPEMLAARTAQARRYDETLARLEELAPPHVPAYATHCYSSYCVRLRPRARVNVPTLVSRMAELGISCRNGIQPLHHEPFFREGYGALALPETEAAARETMFLPIFPGLTEDQQQRVVATLERCLRGTP